MAYGQNMEDPVSSIKCIEKSIGKYPFGWIDVAQRQPPGIPSLLLQFSERADCNAFILVILDVQTVEQRVICCELFQKGDNLSGRFRVRRPKRAKVPLGVPVNL
jgi:hypothetical protein